MQLVDCRDEAGELTTEKAEEPENRGVLAEINSGNRYLLWETPLHNIRTYAMEKAEDPGKLGI